MGESEFEDQNSIPRHEGKVTFELDVEEPRVKISRAHQIKKW
jgi:hypothetical protein